MSMSARLDRQPLPSHSDNSAFQAVNHRKDVRADRFAARSPIDLTNRAALPHQTVDSDYKFAAAFSAPSMTARSTPSASILAWTQLPPPQIKLPDITEFLKSPLVINCAVVLKRPVYSYVPSANRRHSPEKLVLLQKVSNMVNYGTLPPATALKLQLAIDHMRRGRLDLDAVGVTRKEFARYCRGHFKNRLQDYKTAHGLGRIKVTINGNAKRY
jgi:hypothetical protein